MRFVTRLELQQFALLALAHLVPAAIKYSVLASSQSCGHWAG